MKIIFQIIFCLFLFCQFETGVGGGSTVQLGGTSYSYDTEAESGRVRKPRCTKPQHSSDVLRVEYVPNYMAPGVQQTRKQQEHRRQQPVYVLNHRNTPSSSDRWDHQNPRSSASKVVTPVQSGKVQATSFGPERRTWISRPRSSLINRETHVLRGNPNPVSPRGGIPVRNSNTGPTSYRNFQGQNLNSGVANQFRRPKYNQSRNFQSSIFNTNMVRNISVPSFNSDMPNRNNVAQPRYSIPQNRSFVLPRRGYIQPNPSGRKPLVGDNQNGVQKQQQAYNPVMSSPLASRRYNIKVKPEVITHINRPYKTLQPPQ